MKKFFCLSFGIITVVTGLITLYLVFTGVYTGTTLAMGAYCITTGVMFIMFEERPRKTETQIKHDNNVTNQGLGILVVILASFMLLMFMSSCSTRNGYGCKGNQSWNKMVRRINSP